jgi:hypothetical protein
MNEKRKQAVIDLINLMFSISKHNVSYDDIVGRKDAWYNEYTMTLEQNHEWIEQGVKYLSKKLKITHVQARKEMLWVNLMWGLKTIEQ